MSEKTIADVLDKSIDKLSGGAAEIAGAARRTAPHAWELLVRAQVSQGWIELLTGIVVVAAAAVAYLPLKKVLNDHVVFSKTDEVSKYLSDAGVVSRILYAVACAGSLAVFIAYARSAFALLLYPEVMAAGELLRMLGK